jgi:hypothetical protein
MALAVIVGILFEVIKGNGTNPFRYEIGNIAAPWLIVPFLGGRNASRPFPAAAAGGALALTSLVSFYITLELLTHSLSNMMVRNYILFIGTGLIAGTLVGAFAGLSSRLHIWWLGLCLPLAFVVEPLAAFVLGLGGGRSSANIIIWVLELVVGVLGTILWVRLHRRTAPQATTATTRDQPEDRTLVEAPRDNY